MRIVLFKNSHVISDFLPFGLYAQCARNVSNTGLKRSVIQRPGIVPGLMTKSVSTSTLVPRDRMMRKGKTREMTTTVVLQCRLTSKIVPRYSILDVIEYRDPSGSADLALFEKAYLRSQIVMKQKHQFMNATIL
jgi:hypothetical protein